MSTTIDSLGRVHQDCVRPDGHHDDRIIYLSECLHPLSERLLVIVQGGLREACAMCAAGAGL